MSESTVPASPPAPGHTAYSTIVEHENDMVGLIGYSLYKRDKLAFMTKQLEIEGRPANEQEMLAFCRAATLPGPAGAYRAQATLLMQQMYDDLLSVQTTEIEEKYKGQFVEELKKKHPFWESVWEHVVASLVLIAFGGLIALIYAGEHAGWPQMVSNVFNLPGAETPSGSASSPKH